MLPVTNSPSQTSVLIPVSTFTISVTWGKWVICFDLQFFMYKAGIINALFIGLLLGLSEIPCMCVMPIAHIMYVTNENELILLIIVM